MSIEFSCECGRQVRVKPELAGKKIRCPGCGNPLRVPAEGAADEPAAPATKSPPAQEETRRPAGKTSRVGRKSGPIPLGKGAKAADASEIAPTRAPGGEATKMKSGRAAAAKSTGDDLDVKPMEDQDQGKAAGKKTFPCPGCGAALYAGDMMCITCGMDLSTGQWVLPKQEVSVRSSLAKLIAGLVLCLGAVGGAGWWFFGRDDGAAAGNTPKNAAVAPGNGTSTGGGSTETPADRIKQDIEENPEGGLASLAALLKVHKGDALPALCEQLQRPELSPTSRAKALKGIALLARRGWLSETEIPALDAALNDPDAGYRDTVLETLYLVANPRGSSTLDGELGAVAGEIPPAEGPAMGLPSAISPMMRPASDSNDALFFSATLKLILLGQPAYAGNLVELLRNPPQDSALPERAMKLLSYVSGRAYDKPEDWVRWWDRNSALTPAQWLIDAMESEEVADKAGLHARLIQLTGHTGITAPSGGDLEAWRACAAKWREIAR